MTGPRQEDGRELPFAPARRDRLRPGRRLPPPEPGAAGLDEEQADLERGRTSALLGALGRMQLRLDLLAREQRDGLAALQASLDAIEQRLAGAEARRSPPFASPRAPAAE